MPTNVGPVTGIPASITSVTLAPRNNKRQMLSIYNNSSAILYINYGATASIALGGFAVAIPANSYFELPICARGVYVGEVTGVWASAPGGSGCNVTEFTEGF